MPDYKKFFEYWHDLYGTGLKIAGWHLNGELEDFDNFFDSAVESMDGVTIMRTFQGKTYTELWEEFGDVPMNPETECIEVAWCGFPKGTHREDIWHWFEETLSPTHLAFPAFSLISKEKNGPPVLPITVRRFTSAGTMQKKMPLWHGSQKRLNFIGSSLLRKHFWKRLVFVPTELWHKAVGVKLQNGTHR